MHRAGRKPKKNLLTSENPKTGAVTPETVGIQSMEMLRFPSVTHLSERVQDSLVASSAPTLAAPSHILRALLGSTRQIPSK